MRRRFRLLTTLGPTLALGLPGASAEAQTVPEGRSPGAIRTDRIAVTDDPEAERLVIALGPIDLPARTPHHAIGQIPVQRGRVPFDLSIHGYRVEVVDGRGEPVPREVIHHFNLLDPGSRELFLPIMRRVLAASHETPPVTVPGWLLGVPMRADRPFLALAMLHNPTDRTYEDVSVRLVLDYERSDPLYPLYPFHLDVMFPTGSKAFDLPPGRTVRSYEASPAVRGAIVGIGGHVHRHATRLELLDMTTGRVLYRTKPLVDDEGRVEEVPAYRYGGDGLGLPIYPSHRYRVTVTYVNPTGRIIPDGAMGSVAGGFVPFEAWPAADPTDPLFAADYRWVVEESLLHTMNEGGESPGHESAGGHHPHDGQDRGTVGGQESEGTRGGDRNKPGRGGVD